MKLKHVAIIMDGNGRWAKERGLVRTAGHKEGLEVAKRIVQKASELGIPYITLYVFSSENWKRTESETGFLMKLIEKHLTAEFHFYKEHNIRILHIGDFDGLPIQVQRSITKAKMETADFSKTSVILAINYGSQNEILRACRNLTYNLISKNSQHITDIANNPHALKQVILASMDVERFETALDTSTIPPVDLLIRTGNEKRLSNFLLYQAAYAELYFSKKLWPDWTIDDFMEAIKDFENRNRRFGNVEV
ncbi:MAG: di-trans,poly-cis-decaprenylcistransferase [Spirochaetaceae bacterium]|nr:di-trans,poly-cis-decaprenylcistransferase [Spirochaetaceae bacterium]